ncbi:hypothetical protein LCGC14_2813690, partial [marine sediment metagenome]
MQGSTPIIQPSPQKQKTSRGDSPPPSPRPKSKNTHTLSADAESTLEDRVKAWLNLLGPTDVETKKKLAFELDRVVGNMFPGRATLRLLNDTFTRFREEPLTEGGSFLPGATTLPGLTGRPRIREGGVGESTFRRIKGSIVGDRELLVPSSFGTIITERELTEIEKFLVFARRKTGRKF